MIDMQGSNAQRKMGAQRDHQRQQCRGINAAAEGDVNCATPVWLEGAPDYPLQGIQFLRRLRTRL